MPVFTVSQVNAYIKQMFSANERLRSISVSGEVSNCTYHSSGHLYFSIKDRMGQLSCVMFASACRTLTFRLQTGQSVIVHGSMQVYERDGKYQLYAEHIEQEGTGRLFEQIEERKRKLAAEGLFDEARKKRIPKYAMTVGVVTAPTGAAIHDIMQITARRNPYVQLILSPSLVQGESAAESIVRALARLDAIGPDVIIVGRGGGSAEDLMAFQEESVVRAVAACKTPVISAVGHEVDFSLTDLAADLRAPTPSAAAELAVFEYLEFAETLAGFHAQLAYDMKRKLNSTRARMEALNERLLRVGPAGAVKEKRAKLALLEKEMKQHMADKLTGRKHRLELLAGRLHAQSPAARLSGGYAFVAGEDGVPVRSVGQVSVPMKLKISLKDGVVYAKAEKTEKAEIQAQPADKKQ